MSAQPAPTYSFEAVQAILAEAASRQASAPFTQAQLFDMAAEMGVSADLVEQVAEDWQRRQLQQQQEQARQQKQRRYLREQIATYAIVNTGLIVLNIACAGTITWAIYPLLGWGLGLCCGGCRPANPESPTTRI